VSADVFSFRVLSFSIYVFLYVYLVVFFYNGDVRSMFLKFFFLICDLAFVYLVIEPFDQILNCIMNFPLIAMELLGSLDFVRLSCSWNHGG